MNARTKAQWAGWAGTALSMASWFAIWWIGSVSLSLGIGLMAAGAGLCVYGAVRRSRWFWVPAIASALITVVAIWAASRPEP